VWLGEQPNAVHRQTDMVAGSTMRKRFFLELGHRACCDGLWYVGTHAECDRIDAETVR
jgi:hypothetical protein